MSSGSEETPSSELRSASPLEGEAVERVKLAQVTASPLRGEAERSSDEGDTITTQQITTKKNDQRKSVVLFVCKIIVVISQF